MLIHFALVFSKTLIVPKSHLNHRLTFIDGPKAINSATHDSTRVEDYFDFDDQYSYLSNNEKSLCAKSGKDLYPCEKSAFSMPWRLEDTKRELRFRNPNGECLTITKYDISDDSYQVELKDCDEADENQIFILFKDHGRLNVSPVSAKNIYNISEDEKEEIKKKNKKFEF